MDQVVPSQLAPSDRRRSRNSDYWRNRDFTVLALVVTWSSLMTSWAVFKGIQHDYEDYLGQWALVREGADPWGGNNAYGPIHNLLAFLAVPTALGPKVFMTAAFVMVNFLMVMLLLATGPSALSLLLYAMFVPLNFLVIGIVFSYGLNDALTAALIGLAVMARFRRLFMACGMLLGLAVLLKYHPALLIPFFCLNGRLFNWRILGASVVTIVIGFLAAWVTWGSGFVTALSTGVSRDPKLLSIFSALERNETLGSESVLLRALIQANVIAVLGACLVVFFIAYRLRLSWIEGATIASLGYLLIYKVGHQQFYIPWILLLVGLLILGTSRSKVIAFICLPYVVFLAAFQFGYDIVTDGYNSIGGLVRDYVGFASFALGSLTIIFMLYTAIRIPTQVPFGNRENLEPVTSVSGDIPQ